MEKLFYQTQNNLYAKTSRMSHNQKRKALYGYLFIFPVMLGYLIFSLIPVITVLVLSLFKWDLISTPIFIGFQNFIKMFKDPLYWNVIIVSSKYVVFNIIPQYIIAMILALCLNRITKGMKFYRTILLIPWITTPVAMAVVWNWILNPSMGVMNYYLTKIGIGRVDWFSTGMSLKTISMINIWQYVGFTTLLFLIGIQSIPKIYYEAATIDGSSNFYTFLYITIPLLKPTLMYVFITGFINSFQVFDSIYAITKGGPGVSTRVYNYEVYVQGFNFLKFGYASAMCVILLLILMTATIIQIRIFRSNNEY